MWCQDGRGCRGRARGLSHVPASGAGPPAAPTRRRGSTATCCVLPATAASRTSARSSSGPGRRTRWAGWTRAPASRSALFAHPGRARTTTTTRACGRARARSASTLSWSVGRCVYCAPSSPRGSRGACACFSAGSPSATPNPSPPTAGSTCGRATGSLLTAPPHEPGSLRRCPDLPHRLLRRRRSLDLVAGAHHAYASRDGGRTPRPARRPRAVARPGRYPPAAGPARRRRPAARPRRQQGRLAQHAPARRRRDRSEGRLIGAAAEGLGRRRAECDRTPPVVRAGAVAAHLGQESPIGRGQPDPVLSFRDQPAHPVLARIRPSPGEAPDLVPQGDEMSGHYDPPRPLTPVIGTRLDIRSSCATARGPFSAQPANQRHGTATESARPPARSAPAGLLRRAPRPGPGSGRRRPPAAGPPGAPRRPGRSPREPRRPAW